MKNLVIFASGNGSNAQNIIEYFNSNSSTASSAKVVRVICNRTNAYVLERAAKLGVPTSVITKEDLSGGPQGILEILEKDSTDLIILAGYLLKIPDEVIAGYKGRIINIHPSLLPAYGGKGMYGNRVHEAVIAAGERVSGITIHLVDENYDSGKILFQAECPLLENDTPETLAGRIHKLEHTHFPHIIEEYIKDYLP
ncbi:MAG: phosphoribosylglycinamide formyltransferase [Bacteroidales bacterium]|nr:phosphoribosylglycinamide formyltransferase [Bacteroidales bacterium]